ncbi:hypothetical protein D621_07375 [beta proteobacterium AAP51]|nr:hypothetical protein D621_07375 [beta proteobacterium AAP51]
MTLRLVPALLAASLLLGLSSVSLSPAHAQGSTLTRAQVKMDRDAFLAIARWDESLGNWVLKDNMPMPAGVASREEVKAMRDKFLSAHTWDENTAQWLPIQGTPRDMSKLTREQVKMETSRFLKTHRFDESSSTWVARAR